MGKEPKQSTASGPWDVLIYLVKQFPNIAVLAALAAGGFYVFESITEQRNEALKELTESKNRIAILDKEARDALVKASTTLSEARVLAAEAVQQKQLDVALQVQELVAGQLSSMNALEKIRTSSAGLLNNEIEELKKERENIKNELSNLKEKFEISLLVGTVDKLK